MFQFIRQTKRSHKPTSSVRPFKPMAEVLEERSLPSTIVYDVNLAGFTEGVGGPVDGVSIVGTITYDTVQQSIVSSALSMQRGATVLAVFPPTLTEQTLTSDYLSATPTALTILSHAGSGTLLDYWGTVSSSTYSFGFFDDSGGAIDVEITGPPSVIRGFHLGGFGEDGIFGSFSPILLGTAHPVDIAMQSAQLVSGNSVQFTYATTGNPGPFQVGLYRSTDGITYNPADLLDTQTITPSANGGQATGTFNLPALPYDPDLPYLLVVADPSNDIAESDEDNNTASLLLPDHLVVTAQATASVNVGDKFDVQIAAEDINGNLDNDFTGNVTIAVNNPGANPGGGTLGGTLTLPVTNGVADFNDLTLDKPGTGYTLQATSDTAGSATTNPFDVNLAKITFYVNGEDPFETGHAFVQLVPAAGPKNLAWGFYPSEPNMFTGILGLPGQILPNADHPWDWSITFPLSAVQYSDVANFINDAIYDPPAYDLLSQNCTWWGEQVAHKAGVPLSQLNYVDYLGIPDPVALDQSLSELGDGFKFDDGTVHFNTAGLLPNQTSDPPPPFPDQGSVLGLLHAANRDPAGLAQSIGLALQQETLSPIMIGVGQSVNLGLENVDLNNAITLIDFGDGTLVEQSLSASETYRSSGIWQAAVIVINSGAVDEFSFQVDVTGTPGAGTVSILVPNPPPTVPFPPRPSPLYAPPLVAATPTFSGLSAPRITYGTGSTTVSGYLDSNAGGQNIPAGETVSITLNGVPHIASLDTNDSFSTSFDTSTLGVSGSPYTINFSYESDGNFTAANGHSSLTVNTVTPAFSLFSSPTIIVRTSFTTLSGKISRGSLIPTGNVTITVNAVSKSAAINPDGSFSASLATGTLGVGAYPIAYSYGGDANFTAATGDGTLNVTYGVTAMFDQSQRNKAGSTVDIQLELTNANGRDVSSARIGVTALGIASINSPNTILPADSPGKSNPSNQFEFEGNRDDRDSCDSRGHDHDDHDHEDRDSGLYEYNLKLPKSLAAGTYLFYFTVEGDPLVHSVQFVVK